ncbi:exocyst complex component 4 [Onthophagus taurus]|uniref:exocyst complex component 4 n=1 Tax=Onthophagus taurus TaxID=166361 RepID=UPI000C2058B8|nr:exocyst complex component 4 [Onthophagus taurus]
MMDSPPIKPPRGVKPTKETSGLLMSVIRTLSATETNEQRDREKAKLDADYKQCDKRVDDLVQKHEEDLSEVMSTFSNLSHEMSESRGKIRRIKEALRECKNNLYAKRNELEKLWMKGLEYKYLLQYLDEIEKLREVPVKVQTHLNKKEYLHATNLLIEAISSDKEGLEDIAEIKELCMEIEQKKEELHETLLNELKQQIYFKTSQHVFTLSRQNSGREGFYSTPFRRSNKFRASSKRNITRRLFGEMNKDEKCPNIENIEEDIYALNQENNPTHFMGILIKCLALLQKIPFTVNIIKSEMKSELQHIIQRTTLFINDFLQNNDTKQQNTLLEFMHTLFEQFKQVGQAHNLLLTYLKQAVRFYKIEVCLYDIKAYWNQVQFVIQTLLQDYLDMQNMSSESQSTQTFTDDDDLSVYFSRRKQPIKKETLFKYSDSSSALIMSSTLKDEESKLNKVLVCKANMDNLLFMYVPLMYFIEEIEEAMELSHGSACTLNQFLSGYTKNTFLKRKNTEMRNDIEMAIQSKDAWKETVLLDVSTDYKPLLVSTVTIEKTLKCWLSILDSLPMYGELVVKYTTEALREYKDTCQAAYSGIVQPHSEDKRICSAAWLKDDDISRFLKCLPNWVNLKAQQETHARHERRRLMRRETTIEEESPEDIKQRNRKEAEILAGNLGEGGVDSREILSDMSLLKQLAQLQESMEWFSVKLFQFASQFRHEPNTSSPSGANGGFQKEIISSVSLQQLTQIAQDFDELANTCLLLLHLEVRVQCFHYLLAVNDFNKETHEPDPKVLELSKVLSNVDEAMTSSLHPRKCKYIFEGLGHLIAKILISSTQNMQVIDDLGIERMCRNVFALQQMLTNITMTREVALDHARHYFELFFLTPEEILNGIVEKGPEFSELEYMNAFQLLNRSRNGSVGPINVHLERLSDILHEVGTKMIN